MSERQRREARVKLQTPNRGRTSYRVLFSEEATQASPQSGDSITGDKTIVGKVSGSGVDNVFGRGNTVTVTNTGNGDLQVAIGIGFLDKVGVISPGDSVSLEPKECTPGTSCFNLIGGNIAVYKVRSIDISPPRPTQGEDINVTTTVENTGGVRAESRKNVNIGDLKIGSISFSSDPGDSDTGSITIDGDLTRDKISIEISIGDVIKNVQLEERKDLEFESCNLVNP